MVMFKAKFKPLTAKPAASDKPATDKLQAQQQQQPQPTPQPTPPPIEKERGPQYPVKEPGPGQPPERAREKAHA
jgi:hypothetical protein